MYIIKGFKLSIILLKHKYTPIRSMSQPATPHNGPHPNLNTLDSDPYSNTKQQIIKLSVHSVQLHQLITMAGVSSDSCSTKELAEGWEDVESELSICPEPDYERRIDIAFN